MEFYDATEDLLHSVAAFALGVAFAVGVLAVMLRHPRQRIGRHLFDFLAIAAAPLIPLAMTLWPDHSGLLQRLMFAIAFAWYGTEAIDARRKLATASRDTGPAH